MALPPPPPSPPPLQRNQRRRPSPYSWSAAAPLLALPGIVILLAALGLAWGGSGDALTCAATPIPAGLPPEAYARPIRTLLPLGTSCVFGADTPDSITIDNDSWAATIAAAIGTAILATSVIATTKAYRPKARH